MDKKFLSFLLIFFTMLSVSIMLSFNKSYNINSGKELANENINNQSKYYKDNIKELQLEKFYILAYNRSNHPNEETNKVTKGNATSATSNGDAKLQNTKNLNEKVASNDDSVNTDTKAIDNTDTGDEDTQDDKTVSVFKVQRDKIGSEITPSEKSKLMSVAKKLSPLDYIKIYSFIKSPNPEQAVKDAMIMLKSKLSVADYGQVKDVAKNFLNMGLIAK